MKPQGFARTLRIRTPAQYQAVFDHPHRFSVDNVIAFCQHNTLGHPRLGISVSKVAFKHAIDRNTVKRVIRDSFRHRQTQLNGLDIVIVVKQPLSTLSKSELRECLERLWQKVETLFAGA